MRRATLIAALAAVALVPVAGASRVAWDETAKDGKVPVMGFRVDSLTFGKGTWSAHVTMSNLSKKPIRIGNQFGAAIYDDGTSENLDRAIGFAVALTFSPARPTVLEPGATWRGTIGGDGELKASASTRYARLVFGPLTGLPGQKRSVFWVMDHRLVLPPSGSAAGPVV